jgi:hypothetical protein
MICSKEVDAQQTNSIEFIFVKCVRQLDKRKGTLCSFLDNLQKNNAADIKDGPCNNLKLCSQIRKKIVL